MRRRRRSGGSGGTGGGGGSSFPLFAFALSNDFVVSMLLFSSAWHTSDSVSSSITVFDLTGI